jgi:hypothetical protein
MDFCSTECTSKVDEIQPCCQSDHNPFQQQSQIFLNFRIFALCWAVIFVSVLSHATCLIHQNVFPDMSLMPCVTTHLLAWKVITSVDPQIPFFLGGGGGELFFRFYTMSFRSGHFVTYVWNEWFFCDCSVIYWHKILVAGGGPSVIRLVPFSLAYIIMFNLKPTVYEIAVCSVHILSGEKMFTKLIFILCHSEMHTTEELV